MRILYLDCGMGAAGDMLTAALLDLMDEPETFAAEFQALGIPHVELRVEASTKCGIVGRHVRMLIHGEEEHTHDHHHGHDHNHSHHHEHSHHHHHASLTDIRSLISGLPLDEDVKTDALAVYQSIAEAESQVHGVAVSDIHFHEVGTLDAVADVVACCMLMHRLQPDQICASPVRVGTGQVRCAHGILPVPAPATARLLQGIPTYGGEYQGEFCTPTGAALLRHFVKTFGAQPLMAADRIGYGMGTRDFPTANCVRAVWGQSV